MESKALFVELVDYIIKELLIKRCIFYSFIYFLLKEKVSCCKLVTLQKLCFIFKRK